MNDGVSAGRTLMKKKAAASPIELFPREQIVGVFRGFREGGLEFHADLVLPYRNQFQNLPMHGQFLLVQLETPEEAVLGRIASFSSEGNCRLDPRSEERRVGKECGCGERWYD